MAQRRKRARTTVARARRPIDKDLIVVQKTITAAQQTTTLKTTTFPCTVVGIRWELMATCIVAGQSTLTWAIVLVKDGEAANTMSITDAATFYAPEQNVLAFGVANFAGTTIGDVTPATWQGSTKTMRKLMGGDVLQLLVDGTFATQGSFLGVIQFFCKS